MVGCNVKYLVQALYNSVASKLLLRQITKAAHKIQAACSMLCQECNCVCSYIIGLQLLSLNKVVYVVTVLIV